MVIQEELVEYLNSLLNSQSFDDYCPNGLQVQGTDRIQTLVTGVTACQALIEAAVELKASAILVHHGYFWKGENPCIVGMKHQRLKCLLEKDINLIAYHLPLDAHPKLGNNAQLANVLGWTPLGGLQPGLAQPLGFHGRLETPMEGTALRDRIQAKLGREPLYIPGDSKPVQTIGWCTGAAQSFIEDAISLNLDAYITGEASEQTTHAARESGLHFYAAGHHATERYGVKALGEHLAKKFALTHHFVDIENPV